MIDPALLFCALQHGDGQFPGGGFAFSWGLESLQADGMIERRRFEGYLLGQIEGRWRGLERVLAGHAHRAGDDPAALARIDELADAMTLGETQRLASRRAGGALLLVHAQLETEGAAVYRRLVQAGETHGHLAPMQGFLLGRLGLPLEAALGVALYAMLQAACSAATRLGLISHLDAQRALLALRPVMSRAVAVPLPPLADAAGFAPLSDIAMMRHADGAGRLFAS